MRIGELARQSGIVVPTIKYYLRMGLLPVGVMTARNQAEYTPVHLRRLRLVDALVGIGGLTVTGTRTVLAAVDDVRVPPGDLLAAVDAAILVRHSRGVGHRTEAADRTVAATLNQRHWPAPPGTSLRERLTEACAVAGLLEVPELWSVLDQYAAAAVRAAECDLTALRTHAVRRRLDRDPADPVVREAVVVIAVLGAVVQSAMNGLARRDALVRFLAGEP